MAELTNKQRDFLRHHGIALSNVFDASGLSPSSWKARMKELEIGFAFGTARCARAGHTLRTRKGHCIQCSPSNISYYNRYREKGFVYIAHSSSAKRIKIGMTTDLGERGRQLNIYRYGGATDWRFFAHVRIARAGEVECRTQYDLRDHAVAATYFKAREPIACHELFSCDINRAKAALLKNLPNGTSLTTT